jgi:hypothetical protein
MQSAWSKLAKLFWATYGLLLLTVECDGVVALLVLRTVMAPVAVALVVLYGVVFFPIWAIVKFISLFLPISRYVDHDWKWTLWA